MSKQCTMTINGHELVFDHGQTILEVCREHKIPVPTLCHDNRLKPYGGCRLCIVELEGVPRPLTSCTTPAEDGMVVTTESEYLTRLRKTTLELLLSNHPQDCMTCEAAGDCELQELAYRYDVDLERFNGEKWQLPLREDNCLSLMTPTNALFVDVAHEYVMRWSWQGQSVL